MGASGGGGGVGTLIGGGIGSAFGPMGAMFGAGLGGQIGGMLFPGSDPAQQAAMAQQQMAQQQAALVRAQGLEYQNKVMELAKASPQELETQGRALQAGQQQLESQQRMLAAIDPAILEASQQALGLLRGQKAGILGPQEEALKGQRQSLVASLRDQYGPGAETSSAGQKALRQFDMQANLQNAQAQQGALGQLTGIAGAFNAQRPDLLGTGAGLMDITSRYRNRELGAYQQAGATLLGAMSGTSQQLIDTAGSQYLGAQLQQRRQEQFQNQLVDTGAYLAGRGAGGSWGASAAKRPGQQGKMPAGHAGYSAEIDAAFPEYAG